MPREVLAKLGFLHYKAAAPRDKIKETICSTIRSLSIKFKVDPVHDIIMYGGEAIYLHPFFVSALDTGERSAPFLDRFTDGKLNPDNP